ncbi:MAG: phosphatidate cytidylyltransferase [Candidatus Chromulinivorax sp.]
MVISTNSKVRAMTGIGIITSLWILLYKTPLIFFSITLFIAATIMLVELKKMIASWRNFILLAPWYPIIPCMMLSYLHHHPSYQIIVPSLFLLCFTFDTASYLVGKLYSKFWISTKIIPSISPGKSWQGFFGGYLATRLIWIFINHNGQHSIMQTPVITLFFCIVAFAGDIFESYLKRSANLKDSGTLLAGHGGLLDRFDSILFVTYLAFLYKDKLV